PHHTAHQPLVGRGRFQHRQGGNELGVLQPEGGPDEAHIRIQQGIPLLVDLVGIQTGGERLAKGKAHPFSAQLLGQAQDHG
ncbi:MAG: hypothetical protein ACK55I_01940, partial [bacterium]